MEQHHLQLSTALQRQQKANNLKPYEYFEYLLTEMPKHMEVEDTDRSFLEGLLPWSPNLPSEHYEKGRKKRPFKNPGTCDGAFEICTTVSGIFISSILSLFANKPRGTILTPFSNVMFSNCHNK